MVLNLDGGIGIGLGYASVLLQLDLGLGLVTAFFCSLTALGANVGKKLEEVSWQATLQAATAAASPSLLLAVFTIAQVKGGASDIITPVGLLVAEVAVFASTLLAILGPVFGGEVPEVDARTGDILSKSFEDGTGAATRYGNFARVLSACRALAQLTLLVAALPAGAQLIFASGIARLALFVQALLGIANALAVEEGPFVAACTDVARSLSIVPMISGLTLLELSLWGDASVMLMAMDPAVWCGFAVVAQVALILVIRFGVGGDIQALEHRDFDFGICVATDGDQLQGADRLTMLQKLLRAVYYLAMGALVTKIFAGTYRVSGSLTGMCIEWGDPLIMTATSLALIAYIAQLIELAAPEPAPEPESNGTNGIKDADGEEHAAVVAPSPGISEPLKKIVGRAPGLILACIVSEMVAQEYDGYTSLVILRYGFALTIVAMTLQAVTLVAFAIVNCDITPAPEPPIDDSGTLRWELQGETGSKVSGLATNVTVTLLAVGLTTGFISLGALPWLVVGLPLFLIIYLCLPEEAKAMTKDILSVIKSTFLSRIEAYLAERRAAAEAAAAQRAAAKKAAEEKILAEWAQNEKASKKKEEKAPVEKTAAGKAAAVKATQEDEEEDDEKTTKSKKKGGAKSKGGKKKK